MHFTFCNNNNNNPPASITAREATEQKLNILLEWPKAWPAATLQFNNYTLKQINIYWATVSHATRTRKVVWRSQTRAQSARVWSQANIAFCKVGMQLSRDYIMDNNSGRCSPVPTSGKF